LSGLIGGMYIYLVKNIIKLSKNEINIIYVKKFLNYDIFYLNVYLYID
jgi:hypothetical protein